MMGKYLVGQVCNNGHQITGDYHQGSEFSEKFCSQCGAETSIECSSCQAPIRGFFDHAGGVITIPKFEIPKYCHNCGDAFPWTRSGIEAASELTLAIDGLTKQERSKVTESITELTKDTPQTQVAIARVKGMLSKAAPSLKDGIKKVLVSVVTEAVKKQMGF